MALELGTRVAAPPPSASASASGMAPGWRPALWPAGTWARVALVAVLVFTFARGVLWDTTTPTLWGPDEDYHFMYVDTVAREGRIIDPARPLYSIEYSRTAERTSFNVYGSGQRLEYLGDPKASVRVLELLPEAARRGTQVGRGIGVVHPPLFHALSAVPDALASGKSLPTRMFWTRVVSALWGTLAVYAAWLLGAQVLRRFAGALLVAWLVATQPMLGYLSGLVNHDIALSALFTLACAQVAFMLRSRPSWRQGALLGALIGLALLVKASAAALLAVAAVAFGFQALRSGRSRQLALSAGAMLGGVVLLAGWWYVHTYVAYGSISGIVVPDPPSGGAPPSDASASASAGRGWLDVPPGEYALWAREWLSDWYKTSFFHFFNYEAPRGRWFYFVPAFLIGAGLLAFASLLWSKRRRLRHDVRAHQLITLSLVLPLLLGPFMLTDFGRKVDGMSFFVNAGRYVLPAWAPFVVCLVAGLLWVVRRSAQPVVGGALAVAATLFVHYVWSVQFVVRYFGEAPLGEHLRRLAFDRPSFITPTSLAALLALIAASVVVALVATWMASRDAPEPGPAP